MTFTQTLVSSIEDMLPDLLWWTVLPLIPFVIAERVWPAEKVPKLSGYVMNILIGVSTAFLSLPLGLAAGLWASQVRDWLPWKPISFTFHSIACVPVFGPGLEVLAMIIVPLLVHDGWFYWSHRLEHRVPFLWAFHKIHHSDAPMNTSTYERDHFLQNSWRAFFSVFTLGLIVDLDLTDAGRAAFYSTAFLVVLSCFYHSAIRIQLPWLDRILVTPQVHRIHHSIAPEHYNRNFADALPIFDMVFGTYHRPLRDEFPTTGLGSTFPAPRSLWSAQAGPLAAVWKLFLLRR